jgi:superfamily II DNA or RNA helicase
MPHYLGKKGYTIHKSEISVTQQENIRKALRVCPYVPNSPVKGEEFEIYRESTNKLYVPRYFGTSHFGKPQRSKLPTPAQINLPFAGDLRDYQKHIVGEYMKKAVDGGGLLEIPCGRGKTVMALKILSELGMKTLVIVHKSFLLNQWVERINQFLPGARVGRIQGQTIDIEDKDIVLGMLQSLSMKDYPETMFDSFGLTIVDEVHHIAAEVFVRSLFKIVTKNMLGLSATMQRKDGLTKVFKMFLGDVIYKEKSNKEHNVLVKAIEFKSNDEEFNTVVYDYRGNPQYSTMISKLCNFYDRSNFILKILKETFMNDSKQQIIVLAHNKNLLTYLYKAIDEDNYATVGYYVGGMKEAALKESESKNIIIATYSMASEALDIKTLTTLLMATPKTDITQSVGRILRTKHAQPVVIDIIDKHDLFQRQWIKRKIYYQRQNYTIVKTTNVGYQENKWKTLEKNQKGEDTKKNNTFLGTCLI